MRAVIVAGDPFAPAADAEDVYEHLDDLNGERKIDEIVRLDRPGIEEYAGRWADSHAVQERIFTFNMDDTLSATCLHVARAMSLILLHNYATKVRSDGGEVTAVFFGERGVGDLIRKMKRDQFEMHTMVKVEGST
jgi:hypothetical protein